MVEHIDLMVDEFKRIKACPGADAEIRGLCDRAIERTHQNVPVIVQRDEAQAELVDMRRYAEKLEEALKEIKLRAMGYRPNEANMRTIWDLADAALGSIPATPICPECGGDVPKGCDCGYPDPLGTPRT